MSKIFEAKPRKGRWPRRLVERGRRMSTLSLMPHTRFLGEGSNPPCASNERKKIRFN